MEDGPSAEVTQTAQGNYIAQASGPGASALVDARTIIQQAPDPARALHQLPAAPADFTGRQAELAELQAAVETGGAVISGLVGLGGVGKTALATVLADRLCEHYPDAQLFLDLRGTTQPFTPAQALAALIRAFEPELKLPEAEAELRALYLSLLAGKRAIVLLDNAAGRDQVAPLVPPGSCLLLVTSRVRFALPGLKALPLEALRPEEAQELVLKIEPRVGAQVGELARRCGYLPLALRAAASLLAVTDDLDVADYLAQLADERRRLEAIGAEGVDHGVDAAFGLSYARLSAEEAAVFTRLAVFPTDFAAQAAEVVAEDPEHRALSRLVRFSLVDFDPERKRYRLHDLVRVFAQARLSADETTATRRRHAAYFCDMASAANDLYQKGGDHIAAGLALFDSEWSHIQAGQAWAASLWQTDDEATRLAARYPLDGAYLLDLRQHPRERIAWMETSLEAARKLGKRQVEGAILGNLGNAYARLGDARRAIVFYEQHLVIAREIGDRRGEGSELGNLGLAYADLGDARRAIDFYEQALVIAREIGDRRGEGNALGNLGLATARLGDARRAIEYHERNLVIAREIGDRRGEGAALGNLGLAYADLADARRAIDFYDQQLVITREIGDRRGEGAALGNLGLAYADLGDARRAIEYHEQALPISREIGNRRGEGNALGNLGNAYAALSDARRAIDFYEQHLVIAREIGDRRGEGAALGNLGSAHYRLGDARRAIGFYEQQLVITREIGDAEGFATASFNLARLLKQEGRADEALPHAEGAAAFFERIGHPEYARLTRNLVSQLRGEPATSGPSNDVLTRFGPLIDAAVAAAQGGAEARTAVEKAFEQLTTSGWMIAEPIRHIWAGERDAAALTQGLDESGTLIVGEIVRRLQE